MVDLLAPFRRQSDHQAKWSPELVDQFLSFLGRRGSVTLTCCVMPVSCGARSAQRRGLGVMSSNGRQTAGLPLASPMMANRGRHSAACWTGDGSSLPLRHTSPVFAEATLHTALIAPFLVCLHRSCMTITLRQGRPTFDSVVGEALLAPCSRRVQCRTTV